VDAARSNHLLGDVTSLSENLAKVGTIGLEALEYVGSGKSAPSRWAAEKTEFLKAAEEPNAEVVLAAVRPVRVLVEAAQNPRGPRADVRK
jgi:hexosaminidase